MYKRQIMVRPSALSDTGLSIKDLYDKLQAKIHSTQTKLKLLKGCLLYTSRHQLDIWEEFLHHVTESGHTVGGFPIWTMEFGATYNFEGKKPKRGRFPPSSRPGSAPTRPC